MLAWGAGVGVERETRTLQQDGGCGGKVPAPADPPAAVPPRGPETEAGVPGGGQSLEGKLRWRGRASSPRVPRVARRNFRRGEAQDGGGAIPDVRGSAVSILR